MVQELRIIAEPMWDMGPQIQVAYPGAGDLALIAALCVISLLLSVFWLIAVCQYTALRRRDVE